MSTTPSAWIREDSLEDAYAVSQNFDERWTDNTTVIIPKGGERELRSTSVGDVFLDLLTLKWYVVDITGMTKLNF